MANYYFQAKNDQGTTITGYMSAANEDDLGTKLSQRGLFLVESRVEKSGAIAFERITRKDLITFTVHLSTVLSAGVPLLTGLEDLLSQTEKARFRLVIEQIISDIESGLSLSQALAKHPRVFSELYVSLVRAGEATGNVDSVLKDIINFLEWQEELASNIKQALFYPAILLTALFLLAVFLFMFVLPRFVVVFRESQAVLPLPTRILLTVSAFLSHYWYVFFLSAIGMTFCYRLVSKTYKGRYIFDKIKLKLPIFGGVIKKVALSRFAHHLSALSHAGIDIIQSLWITEKVVGNEVLAGVIRNALVRVKEGEKMSVSLAASGEFPPLVIRMLSIGESTGAIETTLDRVSQYYDREVPATIRRVFTIMEPVVVILMGVLVVTVALSMFLPMYQMIRLAAVK